VQQHASAATPVAAQQNKPAGAIPQIPYPHGVLVGAASVSAAAAAVQQHQQLLAQGGYTAAQHAAAQAAAAHAAAAAAAAAAAGQAPRLLYQPLTAQQVQQLTPQHQQQYHLQMQQQAQHLQVGGVDTGQWAAIPVFAMCSFCRRVDFLCDSCITPRTNSMSIDIFNESDDVLH